MLLTVSLPSYGLSFVAPLWQWCYTDACHLKSGRICADSLSFSGLTEKMSAPFSFRGKSAAELIRIMLGLGALVYTALLWWFRLCMCHITGIFDDLNEVRNSSNICCCVLFLFLVCFLNDLNEVHGASNLFRGDGGGCWKIITVLKCSTLRSFVPVGFLSVCQILRNDEHNYSVLSFEELCPC